MTARSGSSYELLSEIGVATMNVWLVTVAETMPVIDVGDRKMRTALLGEALSDRGHQIVWWNSTINHRHKKKYFDRYTEIEWKPGFVVRMIDGPLYRRNISPSRYLNHIVVAYRFVRHILKAAPPDIIYCSLPTPELAAAAAWYGRKVGRPVVIDVRDLWPDELIARASSPTLRRVLSVVMAPMSWATKFALRNARGITAISPSYLAWARARATRRDGSRDRVFYIGYPKLGQRDEAAKEIRQRLIASGVAPERKIFLFIGTFTQGIDIEVMVSAARILAEKRRADIQIVIAGEGERKDWLVENSRGLPNLIYVGWQSRDGIQELLRLAWVGLGAYRAHSNVSLGNKMFEYASGALPVLMSLGGDARQLIESNDLGCHVRAEDAQALADAIERYTDDRELRARQSRNSAAFFAGECDAEVIYPQLADHLERLAWSSRSVGPRA